MDSQAVREVYVQYLPDSSEINYWMFAMIGIGMAFIVFVAVSIYLVCLDEKGQEPRQVRSGTISSRMHALNESQSPGIGGNKEGKT